MINNLTLEKIKMVTGDCTDLSIIKDLLINIIKDESYKIRITSDQSEFIEFTESSKLTKMKQDKIVGMIGTEVIPIHGEYKEIGGDVSGYIDGQYSFVIENYKMTFNLTQKQIAIVNEIKLDDDLKKVNITEKTLVIYLP